MHCFKDNYNNRKYILHFIRLLLTPKSPILPNLGGYRYPCTCTQVQFVLPKVQIVLLKSLCLYPSTDFFLQSS